MLTKRNVSIVIVGNKSDLSDQRQVSFLEGICFLLYTNFISYEMNKNNS